MAAHVVIELDVTPPELVWGSPAWEASEQARMSYALSDGHVSNAEITSQVATIFPTHLRSAQAFRAPAMLDVRARVMDDVGNAVWASTVAWLYAPPEPVVVPGRTAVIRRRRFRRRGPRITVGAPGRVT